MYTQEELESKYLRIPQEIKQTRRWICYKIEMRDGKQTKVPYCAINGDYAKSNDSSTWTIFRVAISGCVKFGFDGIGFMLGEDKQTGIKYFGIDLDNHEDEQGNKPMTQDDFFDFSSEFINTLQSYTEYSHSGEGIHIICKGSLPEGARRKAGVGVEMYDKGRFFTMSGNVILDLPIMDRTEEIKPLWEKYLNTKTEESVPEGFKGLIFGENRVAKTTEISVSNMSDTELIEKIQNSRFGMEFMALYNGDMSKYKNDHSAADMALCQILAFWTACDKVQMDRIFRSSALMRPKWEQRRGVDTYGNITLDNAISKQMSVYTPGKEKITIIENVQKPIESPTEIVEYDERNDPIIKTKTIFKTYPLTDTGNAERFYDQFGENFKYNKDNQYFMFWNGKTWTKDIKGNIRKYANKLIDVLEAEVRTTEARIKEVAQSGSEHKEEDLLALKQIQDAQVKNVKKVANKAGKDAMLSELQNLHDLPVVNSEFDTQDYLLNTDSGVVNLNTGEIKPFDKNLKLSKNTNCKVDFSEPVTWLKFLHDILERGNPEETEELLDTLQMALGESLTGRTNKDHLFIMYGTGSNGKSTFIKVVNEVFGDYGTSMNSDLLLQNQNSSSQSNEFSLAALLGARMVSTSETAEGKKLDEVMIKQMLSGEKMTAQFKYGQSFSFLPTFSPWMSTNNRPIIRATDFGTWRRIFYIPFLNTFTEDKKDVDMPKKLAKENAQILGWMIKGAVKLHQQYQDKLPKPKCLEEALSEYKQSLDVISAFILDRCIPFPGMQIEEPRLYQEYKEWTKQNNEYCFSESRFKTELPKKGYKIEKDANLGWVVRGLKMSGDRRGLIFGDE
ncbi:MAG: DUF5906 domain-containing protein [Clostridia bacterium]|nr:DUF5906 domain-containing protein [Clostridia bacterium]